MVTLESVQAALLEPFPIEAVEVKPGATSDQTSNALALAYADARVYQARLDEAVGPSGWSVEYREWGTRSVFCRLMVLGVVREDVGEAENGDPNQATSAAMQAFKRACAAFGLGRYLYNLPQLWVEAEKKGKTWVIKDPVAAVRQMYQRAGLLQQQPTRASRPAIPAATSERSTLAAQLNEARKQLKEAGGKPREITQAQAQAMTVDEIRQELEATKRLLPAQAAAA